ncbi:MAG: hypothetical protein O9289_05980 [Rhodobacteraceae bacterium]|jgi:hypothetical protein|nr:hypothetical protein [Paracoccaceae bacterium]
MGSFFVQAGRRNGIEPRQMLHLPDAIEGGSAADAQEVTLPAD